MPISRPTRTGTRRRPGERKTHLSLGLCFTLRTKPVRQRGLDHILYLKRGYPAQPWGVSECRDGRAHARPTGDSGRVDILGNGIRKGLLSDTKAFGSYTLRQVIRVSIGAN